MSKYDLSRCVIDYTLVPDRTRVLEFYPELSAYPEFKNATDNEIKIAISIADINSPFIKIKEPVLRLNALFEFLDIGLKNPKTQELYDQTLNYTHPRVIPACCRVIQIINNHDYAIWWTLNLSFYDLQKESAIPRATNETTAKYVDTKSSITNQMDKIGEKLKTYEARLFNDVKLKQALVDNELKKISFFPEKMAEQFPGYDNL